MKLNNVIITLIIATTLIIIVFSVKGCIQESEEKQIIKHSEMTPLEKCIDACLGMYGAAAEENCVNKCFETYGDRR